MTEPAIAYGLARTGFRIHTWCEALSAALVAGCLASCATAPLDAPVPYGEATVYIVGLTSASWQTRTLPADNLDDPAVYLLAKGLAEVVDGRLQDTPAAFALRKWIERD
jgi:hypothetical protein